jgi:hypothetical protein
MFVLHLNKNNSTVFEVLSASIYWLSYYEDYRHFEGILSKESFELYVIVLDNIFTRDLWETPKIFKMTLIINDNLSSIYQFSCSIPL